MSYGYNEHCSEAGREGFVWPEAYSAAAKILELPESDRETKADANSYGSDHYRNGCVIWLFDDGSELERTPCGEWIA